ncbi:tetratricopeptide repeat protein [Nonomuraea sp. K274]|uniref:Tetratricopeptide repeat protein n=1 Tax=Nonomuraea cypriaca TaxID=1187855 RepID=A0A931AP93_9ACTN|nr:tetratricopeptide repeat protein [Nonomuraea cypriaca]MBF8194589.1 tetratricopeptide repeat protein [Nonomuraea cypriaca]
MRSLAIFAGLALFGATIFTILSFSAAPASRPATVTPFTESLQDRLKRLPGDHRGWAQLASQYVDQARITGDPSYYTKAEGALATAARLEPGDDTVLTGQAALAAGRHEFSDAVRLAERAIKANPYGAAAYGVLADARTQLGDLPGAERAVVTMMDLRPGVAAFARASYAAELRGDPDKAREYLEYAHSDAWTPADLAYARYYLGELALHAGDLATAGDWYAKALQAYPAYPPALAGQARTAALSGRLPEALALYDRVVERLPLPQYLIEQGETRLKAGQPADWTLLRAQRQLFEAAGVRDDLTWAEFEADHGDPALAVKHARAEYARNPNLVAADALAWALFKAGEPEEALPYAKQATSTGWRNPLLRYHRARIEQALGRSARVAPGFDPALSALARFS